tara:strand:+ start:857310 stop:857684 length:375 start_codon:yes stop_codon:yes gene_type:complete
MRKEEPKNPRLSLHHKYKRRLPALSWSVAEFLTYAEQKLNPDIGGNIHKRTEIEAIVSKCKELQTLPPDPQDANDVPPIREGFLEVLQSAGENTKKILAEADKFLKELSEEEWEEMRKAYKDQS